MPSTVPNEILQPILKIMKLASEVQSKLDALNTEVDKFLTRYADDAPILMCNDERKLLDVKPKEKTKTWVHTKGLDAKDPADWE